MARGDFFARFYTKVFIGLYEEDERLHVGVVTLTNRGEAKLEQRLFDGGLGEEALAFIREQIGITPYNYIALLTDSAACGALPTCSLSKAKEMAPVVGRSKTVCVDEEWMNYCDEELLYGMQERFALLSPDAIYSPFALLHAFFEETLRGVHGLYLLVTPEAMSMVVVKERHLRFAHRYVCEAVFSVETMVARVTASLDEYYEKPCCRGEFIEAAYVIDSAGTGEALAEALEAVLLVETQTKEVDAALLCAQTCMKENGYAI